MNICLCPGSLFPEPKYHMLANALLGVQSQGSKSEWKREVNQGRR